MDNLILFLILGELVDNFNKDMKTLNKSNGNARYKKMTDFQFLLLNILIVVVLHTYTIYQVEKVTLS